MLFPRSLTVRALARVPVLPGAADGTKDPEILGLRQQPRGPRRQAGRPSLTTLDRVLPAAASRVLPRDRWAALLVTPPRLLRWHREPTRRRWTHRGAGRPGRPPIDPEVSGLSPRTARENPRWGCLRLQGAPRRLGVRVGATTTPTLPRARGLGPAPRRSGPTRSQLLRAQARGITAGGFFTVEAVQLTTLDVLFCVAVGTGRVHPAGVTNRPDAAWVTQGGRDLAMHLGDQRAVPKFLVHDRDSGFPSPLDGVLRTGGVRVTRAPVQAPKAGASAERWVQTVPAERLDWTLVLGRGHLERLPRACVEPCNTARPRRGLGLGLPAPREPVPAHPDGVCRRDLLAGLTHQHRGIAACLPAPTRGDRGEPARAAACGLPHRPQPAA